MMFSKQLILTAKRLLAGGCIVCATILLFFFPLVHLALVMVNFLAHFVVHACQLLTSRLPRIGLRTIEAPIVEPFVSIHVPAHNEPPELLAETLRSLSRLHWRNYEVLVIDNNTEDESLWQPIQALCEELGPRFRFFHVENLAGFKAGALNYVGKFMDPAAEFVFVVDADYLVRRNALRCALKYFTDKNIGLIQFPQDYRNVGRGNVGIALDFKHFFSGYMTMANAFGCVPSTGTLTLINVAALKQVGGFDTKVITEDADLGFRLALRGFRCIFANESVGQGVMPYDLKSLKTQRWRWAFGNAQILKLNWKRILFGGELHWRQKIGFVAHLTAWFNFNLIPSISLILLAPGALVDALTPMQEDIIGLSGVTLLTFMFLRFGTIFYSLRHEGHTYKEIWLAYLTHVGLGWIFSASWLTCLLDHRARFLRTNKFLETIMPGPLRGTLAELSLGICLLMACIVLAFADFVVGPAAALVMCAARFLVYWVWRQTEHTFRLSKNISAPAMNAAARPEPLQSLGRPLNS